MSVNRHKATTQTHLHLGCLGVVDSERVPGL